MWYSHVHVTSSACLSTHVHAFDNNLVVTLTLTPWVCCRVAQQCDGAMATGNHQRVSAFVKRFEQQQLQPMGVRRIGSPGVGDVTSPEDATVAVHTPSAESAPSVEVNASQGDVPPSAAVTSLRLNESDAPAIAEDGRSLGERGWVCVGGGREGGGRPSAAVTALRLNESDAGYRRGR